MVHSIDTLRRLNAERSSAEAARRLARQTSESLRHDERPPVSRFSRALHELHAFYRRAARAVDWRIENPNESDERAPESLAGLERQAAEGCGFFVSDDHHGGLDPGSNRCGRAWHDSIHLVLGTEFTVLDEVRTGEAQVELGRRARLSGDALALLWLDTVGQTRHHAETGAFPEHQLTWLRGEFARLVATGGA